MLVPLHDSNNFSEFFSFCSFFSLYSLNVFQRKCFEGKSAHVTLPSLQPVNSYFSNKAGPSSMNSPNFLQTLSTWICIYIVLIFASFPLPRIWPLLMCESTICVPLFPAYIPLFWGSQAIIYRLLLASTSVLLVSLCVYMCILIYTYKFGQP